MTDEYPGYDEYPDYTEGLLPDGVESLDQANAEEVREDEVTYEESLAASEGQAHFGAAPVFETPSVVVPVEPWADAGTGGAVVVEEPTVVLAEVPVTEGSAATLPQSALPPITWRDAFSEITSGGPAIGIGALVLSLLAGSLMIAFTNTAVRTAIGYFIARPRDTFEALGRALVNAYGNLVRGSIFNWQATGFTNQIMPLMNTLANAAPLIVAGLAVALAFKAGLFNIGGRGQMIMGAIASGWLAIAFRDVLPFWALLPLCVIAGALAGAFWGAIAGWLKAAMGAHEVISTIMLNFVAFYLLQYLLATQGLLQAPGSTNPITAPTAGAAFPHLFGSQFPVRWSLILALAAVAFLWWLLNRSSLGFGFRAVGENPRAARVAGINVSGATVGVMAISGALCGLAGVFQVLGTITTGFTDGIDAGIGFDAITVALLGGSSPVGVLLAGLLFGAFKAGGANMQAGAAIPVEIVTIIQSLIVLFIAAPPLVRRIFRLRDPRKLADARRLRLENAQQAYAAQMGITERVAG